MARPKLKQKSNSTLPKHGAPRKKSGRKSPSQLSGKNLERAVEQFQSEPNPEKAHQQWKKIETSIFGVQFED
jgi:hypothetical protein